MNLSPLRTPARKLAQRKKFIGLSTYKTKEVNGVFYCLHCDKPCPRGRKRYCSNDCLVDFFNKNNHQGLRYMLMEEGDYRCIQCKNKYESADLVLDHIVPIALGGAEFDRSNLQILCIHCNKPKTAKDMTAIALARKNQEVLK